MLCGEWLQTSLQICYLEWDSRVIKGEKRKKKENFSSKEEEEIQFLKDS